MVVTNNGTDAAPATTVSLSVPAPATFTGSTGAIAGCAPTPATGPATVTCTVPALPPDGVAAASGTIAVVATVPSGGDADPTNNAEDEATTVTTEADVALAITGPATVASGGRTSITLTAANQGPDPAGDVVLTLPAPTGLADLGPPPGCSLAGGTVSCPVPGPLAPGASASVTVTGQASVAAGSTITIAGDAGGGTPPDPRPANDTDTLDVAVTPGSDLAIAKSRSPSGPLVVGDAVTFELVAAYTGDVPSNVVVTDVVPPNYAVGAVTAPGWSCSVAGQAVTCTRASGSVAGASVALGPIRIAATAVASGTPVNAATVGAEAPADPDPSNNTAADGGAAVADPFIDLWANKSGPSPALVVEGSTYGFPISATNLGNAGFTGTVVLTDSLPAGLSVTGYGLNGWPARPRPRPRRRCRARRR